MAVTGIETGPFEGEIATCPLGHLTVTVRDAMAPESPVVANKNVRVRLQRDESPEERVVQTDAQGRFTVHFDDKAEPPAYTCEIDCEDIGGGDRPRLRKGATGATAEVEADSGVYQAVAPLRGQFRLKVRCSDLQPADSEARFQMPIKLKNIELSRHAGDTANTGANGDAVDDRLEVNPRGAEYIYEVDPELEPIGELSSVWFSHGGGFPTSLGPSVDAGADVNQEVGPFRVRFRWEAANNGENRPTARLICAVRCAEIDVEGTIEFRMKFRAVFVVGEGFNFAYAVQLARRFEGGRRPAGARGLNPPAPPAPPQPGSCARCRLTLTPPPATQASPARRWVIASQYDLTDGGGGLENLIEYRDSELRDSSGTLGRFDVRVDECWTRVAGRFPELFDAIVFNNPHPGYGMHYATVKGLNDNAGKYVSAHTLDYDAQGLTPDRFNCLASGGPGEGGGGRQFAIRDATQQQTFVRGAGLPCRSRAAAQALNHPMPGNLDGLSLTGLCGGADGRSQEPLAITGAFRVRTRAADRARGIGAAYEELTYGHFSAPAAAHYWRRPDARLKGLYLDILTCYRRHGPEALKSGGWLFVNGTETMERHLRGDGEVELRNRGRWRIQDTFYGQTYAGYPTNFTDAELHPSWLCALSGAGEPNLANTVSYGYQKP